MSVAEETSERLCRCNRAFRFVGEKIVERVLTGLARARGTVGIWVGRGRLRSPHAFLAG